MTPTLNPVRNGEENSRPPAPEPSRVGLRFAAVLLGLGVLAALLLIVPGTVGGTDGQSMFGVTRSIVESGAPTVRDANIGVPGLGGRFYSKYGPGQSLAAIPLYLIGRAVAPLAPPAYRPELPGFVASTLPAIATALTTILLVLAAVELGAAARGALVLGLIYAFATPAAVYPTQWFSEPLTACALLAAVYAVLRDRTRLTVRGPLLAGIALAVAVSVRIESLLFVPPLLLYILLPRERRLARAAALLLPLGATLAALGLYNAARFGSPLETGYSKGDRYAFRDTHPPHTLASLVEGLYGLLVSPGKGLLEYAPPLLLAPLGIAAGWARRRPEILLLLALFLFDLVAHANVLIRWLGGWSWGPRFLVPALPLALLLLAPLLRVGRRYGRVLPVALATLVVAGVLATLVVAGVLVQVPALVVYEPHTYIYTLQAEHRHTDITRLEQEYTNIPALSPIVGAWRELGLAKTWAPPPRESPTFLMHYTTIAPHTWWHLLALEGVPTAPLAAACALLFLIAALCVGGASWLAPPESRDL